MAFSLLKKKPDTHVENGIATTLQEDEDARQVDDAALLAGDSTDGARNAPPKASTSAAPVPFQLALLLVLVIALIVLVVGGWRVVSQTNRATRQIRDVGAALTQSRHLSGAVRQSRAGDAEAFKNLDASASALGRSMRGLQLDLDDKDAADLGKITPLATRVEQGANAIVAQQKLLSDASRALRAIGDQSNDLQAAAEQVSVLKVQRGASATEISAAGRLVMLTQRIGKAADQLLIANDASPDAVSALGKDLTLFHDTAQGLLDGNEQLHLSAARDPDTRDKIQNLLKVFDKTRAAADSVLTDPEKLSAARTTQSAVAADSQTLVQALEDLQARLSAASKLDWQSAAVLLIPALLIALLATFGLAYVQSRGSRQRQLEAEQQRLAAEQQQQEVKRINDANQAAILRLMNELQTVAEGDLTQQATVTEDITGAIADSVNYTVEELRTLVGSVQGATTRVTDTTSKVEATSTELLAASTEQLREIHETGQSVVDMAGRINQVSGQAQESAQVARQSLKAAASGLTAVQDSIGGMNAIRDQMQETSKRIKRLGESSQEIGEITELIADITEQTNVLALNAAIQAASAGEAGRGFSVVAEEVQRLAERSGGATRQIAALVKTIQTDTQDAVAAMERSTRGVVEGARLSDNAGTALTEIDRVSRRLAQLIEQISSATVQEAQKANTVAGNIQHIFAVTEQTGDSTRSTADQVRELAHIADELRQSVARFKIA
jgi:twitching motility protein PilJ